MFSTISIYVLGPKEASRSGTFWEADSSNLLINLTPVDYYKTGLLDVSGGGGEGWTWSMQGLLGCLEVTVPFRGGLPPGREDLKNFGTFFLANPLLFYWGGDLSTGCWSLWLPLLRALLKVVSLGSLAWVRFLVEWNITKGTLWDLGSFFALNAYFSSSFLEMLLWLDWLFLKGWEVVEPFTEL